MATSTHTSEWKMRQKEYTTAYWREKDIGAVGWTDTHQCTLSPTEGGMKQTMKALRHACSVSQKYLFSEKMLQKNK